MEIIAKSSGMRDSATVHSLAVTVSLFLYLSGVGMSSCHGSVASRVRDYCTRLRGCGGVGGVGVGGDACAPAAREKVGRQRIIPGL